MFVTRRLSKLFFALLWSFDIPQAAPHGDLLTLFFALRATFCIKLIAHCLIPEPRRSVPFARFSKPTIYRRWLLSARKALYFVLFLILLKRVHLRILILSVLLTALFLIPQDEHRSLPEPRSSPRQLALSARLSANPPALESALFLLSERQFVISCPPLVLFEQVFLYNQINPAALSPG